MNADYDLEVAPQIDQSEPVVVSLNLILSSILEIVS